MHAYCPARQRHPPLPCRPRRTYLEVGERHAELRVVRLAQEEVPQPKRLRLRLKVDQHGDDGRPARRGVCRELRMRDPHRGVYILLHTRLSVPNNAHVCQRCRMHLHELDELRENILRERRDLVFNL